jgi:hypothetical protein
MVAIVATYKRAVKVYRDPKRLTVQPVHLPAIAWLKVERPQSLYNILGKTRKSPSYDCQTPILPLKTLPVFFEQFDTSYKKIIRHAMSVSHIGSD